MLTGELTAPREGPTAVIGEDLIGILAELTAGVQSGTFAACNDSSVPKAPSPHLALERVVSAEINT